MEIVFTETAKQDLAFWKNSGNITVQKKITALLQSILQDPYRGVGKPEALKHQLTGYWSRRINKEHRLVYKREGERIIVIALRFHY
jgi:toxin YoeB